MSTVQNILDDIQYRIDTDNDLYDLFNLAIRTIWKRLFYHESDIVSKDLADVKIFSEVTLAADDIAFTNDDPDTITCVTSNFLTSQFRPDMHIKAKLSLTAEDISFSYSATVANTITSVAEDFDAAGFAAGQKVNVSGSASNDDDVLIVSVSGGVITLGIDILTVDEDAGEEVTISVDHPDNPGPYKIETVAATTLTLYSAESLTAVSAGESVKLISEDHFADLPDDFWGLKERPNIKGKTWNLKPLPSKEAGMRYTSAGQPLYYKIKASEMHVYPASSSDIELEGAYYWEPDLVDSVDDTIPFDGLFDDAIAEVIVKLYEVGLANDGARTNVMEEFLTRAVDLFAARRDLESPTHFTEEIDYNDYL